jgi:ATP-dependent Clp protease ATP-binding subunit ClpA
MTENERANIQPRRNFYSQFAKDVVKPQIENDKWNHTSLTLLRKILANPDCNAHHIIAANGVNTDKLLEEITQYDLGTEREIENILFQARSIARECDSKFVGTEHLLLSILDKSCMACELLTKLHIDFEFVRERIALLDHEF